MREPRQEELAAINCPERKRERKQQSLNGRGYGVTHRWCWRRKYWWRREKWRCKRFRLLDALLFLSYALLFLRLNSGGFLLPCCSPLLFNTRRQLQFDPEVQSNKTGRRPSSSPSRMENPTEKQSIPLVKDVHHWWNSNDICQINFRVFKISIQSNLQNQYNHGTSVLYISIPTVRTTLSCFDQRFYGDRTFILSNRSLYGSSVDGVEDGVSVKTTGAKNLSHSEAWTAGWIPPMQRKNRTTFLVW